MVDFALCLTRFCILLELFAIGFVLTPAPSSMSIAVNWAVSHGQTLYT